MKKIIFFYPSKTIGGAQLLFVRLANELAKNGDYKVSILDFKNGFLKSNVSKSVLAVAFEKNKQYFFEGDTVVVTPLSMIASIERIITLDNEGKFLFWGIHPENTIDILRGSFRLKKLPNKDALIKIVNAYSFLKIKKLLIKSLSNRSVIFMDEANKKRTFQFYNINQSYDQYIPIPVVTPALKIDYTKCKKENIAWIGRLSPDKIFSLLYILEKFNNLNMCNIQVHIIGDGTCQFMINEKKYKKLTVIQHGSIANENLINILVENNIGLVFGMGTSMLESSILKLPTLLIDPSYKRIKNNYTPKWLYNTQGYTLGSFEHMVTTCKFETLIDNYLKDKSNIIGQQCFKYVTKNHLLEQTTQKLEMFF